MAVPVLLTLIVLVLLLMGGRRLLGRLAVTALVAVAVLAGFVWFFSAVPPA